MVEEARTIVGELTVGFGVWWTRLGGGATDVYFV